MLIDATRKLPEEYGGKSWPREVEVDDETRRLVDSRWREYGIE
jgi:4-hydroxy-3-polyprenylbenzoate decarboxylase